jgi:PPOX class probable F420-dependent enzyme
MALDEKKLKQVLPRLETEDNIWMATTRKDGRPHLIPIWFVWRDGKAWIATGRDSQKVINLRHNPRVAFSLQDGNRPVIFEGTAAEADDPALRDELAPLFNEKFDWDFRTDHDADWVLVALTPTRIISW